MDVKGKSLTELRKMKAALEAEIKEVEKALQAKVDREALGVQGPIGTWKVSTEGDCEGRTTRELGTHIGDIVEIAKKLSSYCEYSLCFEPVIPEKHPGPKAKPPRAKTNISLGIDSGTWDMSKKARVVAFKDFLGPRDDVEVTECQYHAAVTLKFKP